MSGHSKWSTIKRQKEANDQARGKVFSKLAKLITIAVKTGGGENPDTNSKLRMAIEVAKTENMPKANIERAISKGTSSSESLEEIEYEGFGPFGVGLIIETATDNKNRTAQEMKGILERGGGTLAGPGAVSFNFEHRGELVIKKSAEADEQMLALIDLGVEDIEEDEGEFIIYTSPDSTHSIKEKLEKAGYGVVSARLVKKPKSTVELDEAKSEKLIGLLEKLQDNDDVQNVYTSADFKQ